jgi:telomere length regulation protein
MLYVTDLWNVYECGQPRLRNENNKYDLCLSSERCNKFCMPTNLEHGALTHIRDIVHRLQLPVPDLVTLLSLLSGPLECLGLLPPQFGQHNTAPLPHGTIDVARHIPPIQRALLEHVVSTWVITLREENAIILLEQYFCPDSFCFTSPAAGEVVLLAYSNILSLPLSEYSISLLARLTKEYPVDRLHPAVFRTSNATSKTSITWQDCVRNVAAVPAKVANATEGKANISHLLEHATYFTNVSQRCEALIFSLSINHSRGMSPLSPKIQKAHLRALQIKYHL